MKHRPRPCSRASSAGCALVILKQPGKSKRLNNVLQHQSSPGVVVASFRYSATAAAGAIRQNTRYGTISLISGRIDQNKDVRRLFSFFIIGWGRGPKGTQMRADRRRASDSKPPRHPPLGVLEDQDRFDAGPRPIFLMRYITKSLDGALEARGLGSR